MLPVFLSPGVTIIRCGADRATRAVFNRKAGRLRCEQHKTEMFPVGTAGGSDWLEQACAAIQALGTGGTEKTSAVLVLPPTATLVKHLRTPRVDAHKRARIVAFEAGQNIPCALNEVVWDSVLSGEAESTQEVLLVAAKLGVIEPLCAAAQAAGFALRLILPSSVAILASARIARPARNESELLLNLDAGGATLLQLSGRNFAVRSLLLSAAESADPGELIARLAPEVTRSVLHFQHHCGMPDPVRLVLAGDGLLQRDLRIALEQRLKVPSQGLDVAALVEFAPGAVVSDASWGLVELAGAAATQLRPAQPMVNLLPSRLRTQQRRRRRQPWLAVAVMLAFATPIGPLIHFHRLAQTAESRMIEIDATLAPLQIREAHNRANLTQLAEIERQIAAWQAVHERRTSWLQLLADLQERLTDVEDVWLEKIRIVPATKDEPLKLAVSGRMLERISAQSTSSPEALTRVRALLNTVAESPFVAVVEKERFDGSQPGLLAFEFVLVTEKIRPL